MFGKQTVALVRRGAVTRAVWLRGSPGKLEVVQVVDLPDLGDDALGQIVSRLRTDKVPVSGMVLGVPGSSATLRYHRMPPVPDWRLKLILKYETEEMAEKSGEPLSSDYIALEIPDSAGSEDVHLLGMGKEHELIPALEEIGAAGGRVRQAIPSALGIAYAYLGGYAQAPEETVLLVDIGQAESHLALVREGRLLFARTVSFGTDELDDLLSRRLDLKIEEARLVRERTATGRVPDAIASGVDATMRSWCGQLAQLVSSSVTFCRAQTSISDLSPDRLLLAGEGASIAVRSGIDQEGMPPRIEPLIPQVSGVSLPGDPASWAPIIGLAAAPLDRRERWIDLLPAAYRKKREFRERTLFLWGAAAALLLAVGIQFIAGTIEQGRASGAQSTVKDWNARLQGWNRSEEAATVANAKFRERERRLREELLTGRFHSEVVDRLARDIPDAVSLEKITAVRTEGDGQLGVELKISGIADNSEGEGIVHAKALQDSLEALPAVRRTEIQLGDLNEGSYPFELVVSPDIEMPEKGRRSGRSGGSSRRGNRGW